MYQEKRPAGLSRRGAVDIMFKSYWPGVLLAAVQAVLSLALPS